MIEFDFKRWCALGLMPAQAAAATTPDPGDNAGSSYVMRLTEVHRKSVRVHDGVQPHNARAAFGACGLDDDFSPRRLERSLALAHSRGVLPGVVLTKADVVAPASVAERIERLRSRVSATLDVFAVNATGPAAALALAPRAAAGQTLWLLGSSGAGKSTLTNTLVGAPTPDTGAVREPDSRRKHTTTTRSLFCLPGGRLRDRHLGPACAAARRR